MANRHTKDVMPHIPYEGVPHGDLIRVAQISVYGGNMTALVSWANGRIYIEEYFASSGKRYWSSEQDDAVRSTLERRDIIDNTQVCNAIIVDGQTGPRAAPEGFIMQKWSTFVEKRETISFELMHDSRDPLEEEEEEEEEEEAPPLEYIAASSLAELFGY
jgi:hypothetical protein